jgi:L-ascorbate metabolism protein UlaG (beta-lactamase superfamily)
MLPALSVLVLMLGAAQAMAAQGEVVVQWFGHSAFKIVSPGGKAILIDPFIAKNPKTPRQYRHLDKLGKVDLILLTHGHRDHVGDAPTLAKKHKAKVFAPPGLNDTLATLGILPKALAPRMNKGGVVTPLGPDIKITMVRAEHSSEFAWTNPATGKREIHVGGAPAGWIIELENGFRIYHMGDTGLFGDMRLIGEYYRPDLVLIPVGGHFTMNPKDAAYATKNLLKPKFAIPMHYGTFPVLKGTPRDYRAALGDAAVKVHVPKPGAKVRF